MKKLALNGLGFFALGFLLLTGVKTADHIIPDVVRAPVEIAIKDCQDGEQPE